MNTLIIEIFKENEIIDKRVLPANEKRGEITLYSQVAFAHLGGRFPEETSIPLNEGDVAYKAGKYLLSASSFKVGDFKRLSFERSFILIPYDGKEF